MREQLCGALLEAGDTGSQRGCCYGSTPVFTCTHCFVQMRMCDNARRKGNSTGPSLGTISDRLHTPPFQRSCVFLCQPVHDLIRFKQRCSMCLNCDRQAITSEL